MTARYVDWQTVPWRTVRRGIERKVFTGEGATLALHRISAGHEVNPHAHPYEQIVYILEGVVDFRIGDTVLRLGAGGLAVVRLGAGGLAVVPPNVVHCATLVGDQPALNLDVFTPARPDIL